MKHREDTHRDVGLEAEAEPCSSLHLFHPLTVVPRSWHSNVGAAGLPSACSGDRCRHTAPGQPGWGTASWALPQQQEMEGSKAQFRLRPQGEDHPSRKMGWSPEPHNWPDAKPQSTWARGSFSFSLGPYGTKSA